MPVTFVGIRGTKRHSVAIRHLDVAGEEDDAEDSPSPAGAEDDRGADTARESSAT